MAQIRGMSKASELQRDTLNGRRRHAIGEELAHCGVGPSDDVHRRARAIAGGLFKRNKAALEGKRQPS